MSFLFFPSYQIDGKKEGKDTPLLRDPPAEGKRKRKMIDRLVDKKRKTVNPEKMTAA